MSRINFLRWVGPAPSAYTAFTVAAAGDVNTRNDSDQVTVNG